MDLSLPALLILLAPLVAAIVIMRPSWPEFFLLASPIIVAILVALFAFRLVSFVVLGVTGLLIALCAISIEADDRDQISGSVTAGVLHRILRARDGVTSSERARRHDKLRGQRRLLLARLIGGELLILSLITWYLSV
jgi:hypothetical protein